MNTDIEKRLDEICAMIHEISVDIREIAVDIRELRKDHRSLKAEIALFIMQNSAHCESLTELFARLEKLEDSINR